MSNKVYDVPKNVITAVPIVITVSVKLKSNVAPITPNNVSNAGKTVITIHFKMS